MGISRKVSTVIAAAGLAGLVSSGSYIASVASKADVVYATAPAEVAEYHRVLKDIQQVWGETRELKKITPDDVLYHPERLQKARQFQQEYAALRQRRQELESHPAVSATLDKVHTLFFPGTYYYLTGSIFSTFLFIGGLAGMKKKRTESSSTLPEGRSVPTEPLRRE